MTSKRLKIIIIYMCNGRSMRFADWDILRKPIHAASGCAYEVTQEVLIMYAWSNKLKMLMYLST